MNTDFEIQIERFRATGSHCTGVVVEESLDDYQLVNNLSITKVYVTRSDEAGHRWHIYTVQVSVDAINGLCTHLRDGWYMHFWNGPWILVVFHQRWFLIDRTDVATWTDAIEYGQSIGIPKEQLDFPVPDLNEEA